MTDFYDGHPEYPNAQLLALYAGGQFTAFVTNSPNYVNVVYSVIGRLITITVFSCDNKSIEASTDGDINIEFYGDQGTVMAKLLSHLMGEDVITVNVSILTKNFLSNRLVTLGNNGDWSRLVIPDLSAGTVIPNFSCSFNHRWSC